MTENYVLEDVAFIECQSDEDTMRLEARFDDFHSKYCIFTFNDKNKPPIEEFVESLDYPREETNIYRDTMFSRTSYYFDPNFMVNCEKYEETITCKIKERRKEKKTLEDFLEEFGD